MTYRMTSSPCIDLSDSVGDHFSYLIFSHTSLCRIIIIIIITRLMTHVKVTSLAISGVYIVMQK